MTILLAPTLERTSRSRRLWVRGAAVVAGSAVLLGLGAGTALAHVSVNPNTATAGSYAKLTFRVPTESDAASTVSVRVTLPTDHPFASVSTQPMPGWTVATETTAFNPPVTTGKFTLDEATSAVTWTADDGNGVKPGEFQEFSISVGPVPDVASLVFPATQTYSDGTVVSWSDVAAAGVDPHSLDHPAPVLTITASGDHGAAEQPTAAAPSSDTTAQILGAAALALAAVALLIAVLAMKRSRATSGRAETMRADDDAAPQAADPVNAEGPEDHR